MSKSLKKIIEEFKLENPNFTPLIPYLTGEIKVNLEDLRGNLIGKFNAIKTLWEFSLPKKPEARSRVWTSPIGYKFLVQWSNLVLLRILVRKYTITLSRSEHRTKTQLDDAARSTVSNLEEGFKRPTTSSYLDFLGYTQGSLEEIKGLISQALQDEFLKSVPGSKLTDLGIDLKSWNKWCQNPVNSTKILYYPLSKNIGNYRTLKEINGKDLTFEIFLELVNKTDYLLRKLVESLERKLNDDQKGYFVERARITQNLK